MRATGTPDRDSASHTLILGVGNEALRDEGAGVHAARALAAQGLPAGVRVLAGGTLGYALVGELEGVRRLVLIDAMEMRCAPGTVVTVRRQELRRLFASGRTSLHGTGVLDALDLAEALGLLPEEVWIVGVQPGEVTCGFGLSPAVQQALPAVLDAALAVALAPHGQSAQERSSGLSPLPQREREQARLAARGRALAIRKERTKNGHRKEKDPGDR